MQALRNCSGTGKPARVELNGSLYSRCPRAIYLESIESRAVVRLYLECRKTNTYPSPGSALQQTAYAMDVFGYLDDVFAEQRAKTSTQQIKKADVK